MTVYFTTDPTARVSFWESQVEHVVTGVGLDVGGSSEKADALVEQGLLRVGERTADTIDANVYDPAQDESLAYAASRSPEPTPEELAELAAAEAASAAADAQAEVERQAAEVAAAAEAAKVTAPARVVKPTPPPAAEVQSASSSGDTPASQPTGPDAPQETST